MHLLETLPYALIVLDKTATILYANAKATTMVGGSKHELAGSVLWQSAPHLVTTTLYQAVITALRTCQPLEVEYHVPDLQAWLHVHVSPISEGVAVFFFEDTQSMRLQGALRQSERKYEDLLESISDRVAILTPDGLVLDINQRPLRDAQVQREEVVGTPFAETPWWSYDRAAQAQLCRAVAQASGGETVHFEARIRPQEGWYLDLAVTMTPHLDANRHVEYLIYTGLDITARKRAEAETHALIDALPQLVWTGRPDGYIDSYSQSWCDYTGMTIQQAQGEGWMLCTHPDDQQRVLAVWQHAVQTGRPYETEQRLRHGTTGAYRWFLMQAMPLRDAQSTVLKYVGTCTDIEDRKRAEQQLKESEVHWHVLAETMPQIVWIGEPGGSKEYFNQRWFDYTHATFEHMRGAGWLQFLHPDDHERTLALGRHALVTGEPYEIENRFKEGKTGTYRWFLSRALPMRDETGQIVKWFGTCTDIDNQKRVEEALRESQERVSALMNSSIIGITVLEGEQIVDANDTFLRMTGYTHEDLRTGRMNWMCMTAPEYLARTQQAHRELATQQSMTPYEKEYVCKDGSRLPVLVGGVVLQHHSCQNITFVLDNSARKELEQRKDDFISMASHELRNPLTALKMQTQLVRKRLEKHSQHEAATALARVEGPVKQLERLIRELLDVSKIQAGRLEYLQETVDLEALLHEVADTMQQLHTTHTMVMRGTAPCSLVGDKDRLGQVFTNLLSNAIKYSPGAETVEMDLSAFAETVTIRVQDHGLGIPREQRDKIFERFYRAAGPRQRAIPGLGMGLYIVAEIVKHHGGTITVESEVGKGSTFTVTLPMRREA
ncbi:hypothetical protein KSC_017330 [Ktedonobacter sp. SOSP1-52]|nr:hypothetical protein KSC_017330 [Ktedonobacter sp. SOSP1-52]